ncbi:MAG: Phage protein [Oscillospiraceae bacterium]
MAKHEFGIIDSFEENKWYSDYEPKKYNCISVNDDLVEELIIKYNEELMAIKTYFQTTTQPGTGLDYCGVTLIPPESLQQFRNVIIKANNRFKVKEFQLIIKKITEAIRENKYLIHYGI